MRLTPNMNGTGRDTLVADRLAVLESIRGLEATLRVATPNGRDYQLAEDPAGAREADLEEWRAFWHTLKDFARRLELEVELIDK
jgi:hypothetical protein